MLQQARVNQTFSGLPVKDRQFRSPGKEDNSSPGKGKKETEKLKVRKISPEVGFEFGTSRSRGARSTSVLSRL